MVSYLGRSIPSSGEKYRALFSSRDSNNDHDEETGCGGGRSESGSDVDLDEQEYIFYSAGHFDMLPDEILLRIFSLLEPPQIGRLTQTCVRMNQVCNDMPFWKKQARLWCTAPLDPAPMQEAKYQTLSRWHSYRRRQRSLAERQQKSLDARRKKQIVARVSLLLKVFFFGRPWEWLHVSALIYFSICVPMRLDGDAVLTGTSWAVLLSPLYPLVALCLVGTPLLCLSVWAIDHDFDNLATPEKRSFGPFLLAVFIVHEVCNLHPANWRRNSNSARFAHIFAVALWNGIGIFLLLLIWWLLSEPGRSVPLVVLLLPLMLLALILSCFFCVKFFLTRSKREFGALGVFLGSLSVSLLLCGLRADRVVSMSWLAAISVFISGSAFCAAVCLVLLVLIAHRLRSRFRALLRGADDLFMVSAGILLVVLIPLIAFLLMLAANLDSPLEVELPYSWSVVFVPIFIWDSILFLGFVFLNVWLVLKA